MQKSNLKLDRKNKSPKLWIIFQNLWAWSPIVNKKPNLKKREKNNKAFHLVAIKQSIKQSSWSQKRKIANSKSNNL